MSEEFRIKARFAIPFALAAASVLVASQTLTSANPASTARMLSSQQRLDAGLRDGVMQSVDGLALRKAGAKRRASTLDHV